MKQFQYTTRFGYTSDVLTTDEVNTQFPESVPAFAFLEVGETAKDVDGDLWRRLPDKVDAEQIRAEHLPGKTVVYVPADCLERIATAVTEGMVNTIRTEDDYQRIRALAADRGMSVSQWIACDAVKQAYALIAELDKQA